MAASPERSRTAASSIKGPRAKAAGAAGTPAAAPGRAPRRARQREASESDGEDRMFVNALARGLEILRVFNPSYGALGNQEIARRTGIPKPTVSRLAYTLTKLGYLIYFPDTRRYQLGPAGLSLGYAILSRQRLADRSVLLGRSPGL